jgi:hypothetical protein
MIAKASNDESDLTFMKFNLVFNKNFKNTIKIRRGRLGRRRRRAGGRGVCSWQK